jgi:hypothetical protein
LRIDRRGPQLLQQEFVREHLAGMLHHDAQQLILLVLGGCGERVSAGQIP